MDSTSPYAPDYSHIRPLLLEMTAERRADRLFQLVVDRLARTRNIGCVRIWLMGDGDLCSVCSHRASCGSTERCMHLAAAALDPNRTHDEGRLALQCPRVPLEPVGPVESPAGSTGVVLRVEEGPGPMSWAAEFGFGGVCAQPLESRGEWLGAMEIFTYTEVPEGGAEWLRVIADHAAAALGNSRAFEEIERLRSQLAQENERLHREIREARGTGAIVGASPPMGAVLDQLELVAPTRASVLLLGESGTGKELLAREVHARSDRADQPLVLVNCASVPRDLYESEFFGHAKGAFTGAVDARVGRFEAADGGTLFLDEVGELPLETQAKLLRILQEGQYERVGESKSRRVDVRIVAATNRDLEAEVEAGSFRRDLFYRLNVIPMRVPPLRERMEDIPLLAKHFVEAISASLGRPAPRMAESTLARLCSHEWPGNVRELRNVIERAVILSRDGLLSFDLGPRATRILPHRTRSRSEVDLMTVEDLEILERENIERALRASRGKVSGPGGAAELIGMKPATLASKVRRMGLRTASA